MQWRKRIVSSNSDESAGVGTVGSSTILINVEALGVIGSEFKGLVISRAEKIRTTNSIERLNREIKRRTKEVGVFPNESSCLRLVSAILIDISEKWETGWIFLDVSDGH